MFKINNFHFPEREVEVTTKIYEADEIIAALRSKDFYETVFGKVKLLDIELDSYLKLNIPNTPQFAVPKSDYDNSRLWCKDALHVGDEYIMSFYNMYHQQYMNVVILAICHNVTRNEHIQFWKSGAYY